MWKKVLLVLAVCLLTSPVGWAYKKLACEIEDENTVSYVVADATGIAGVTHQVLFAKRVNNSGDEEYWIRTRVTTDEDRFLFYASVIIDNVEYKIRNIKEPKYYHMVTGESIIPSDFSIYPKAFYSIPQELIEKMRTSKNDYIIVMNRLDKQNVKFRIGDIFKTDIQTIIGLSYKDKEKYWKPNPAK